MLVCGAIALLGFPLDAFWHALFGEDVTLWGPTHLFMIGGAGAQHARPVDAHAPGRRARAPAQVVAPRPAARRRRAAHRPVDLPGRVRLRRAAVPAALPAGADRLRRGASRSSARARCSGAWGAFQALGMFFVIRGALALFVGPVDRLHDAALPALHRRGGRSSRAPRCVAPRAPAALRAAQRAGHRHGRPGGRVGLEPRLDAASVDRVDARPRVVLSLGRRRSAARPRRAPEPERWRCPTAQRAGLPALAAARGRARRGRRARGARRSRCRAPAATARARSIVPTPAGDGRVNVAVTLDPPTRGARRRVVRDPLAGRGARRGRRASSPRCARSRPAATSPSAPCRSTGNWKTMLRLAKGDAPHGPAGVPAALARRRTAPAVPARPRSRRDGVRHLPCSSARRAAAPRG